ncbi:hypothetical protein FA15DRAFT_660127 [Coprinopsis marcescibilis]|uniref:Uncharacterized protein n=1 Tax=Coprinopsis marcescibilis TaxID=230819 RepID=A0A5C3KTM1_COPMA|nr:hypothetical protein FA15DRAFT_660127 [Coprinopsis marcescibilis]
MAAQSAMQDLINQMKGTQYASRKYKHKEYDPFLQPQLEGISLRRKLQALTSCNVFEVQRSKKNITSHGTLVIAQLNVISASWATDGNACQREYQAQAWKWTKDNELEFGLHPQGNATTHWKHPDNAISTRKMPKNRNAKWGVVVTNTDENGNPKVKVNSAGVQVKATKKITKANGIFSNGEPQDFYHDNGDFKGMATILEERGFADAPKL